MRTVRNPPARTIARPRRNGGHQLAEQAAQRPPSRLTVRTTRARGSSADRGGELAGKVEPAWRRARSRRARDHRECFDRFASRRGARVSDRRGCRRCRSVPCQRRTAKSCVPGRRATSPSPGSSACLGGIRFERSASAKLCVHAPECSGVVGCRRLPVVRSWAARPVASCQRELYSRRGHRLGRPDDRGHQIGDLAHRARAFVSRAAAALPLLAGMSRRMTALPAPAALRAATRSPRPRLR